MEEYLRCVDSKRGLSHVDDCSHAANKYKVCAASDPRSGKAGKTTSRNMAAGNDQQGESK